MDYSVNKVGMRGKTPIAMAVEIDERKRGASRARVHTC